MRTSSSSGARATSASIRIDGVAAPAWMKSWSPERIPATASAALTMRMPIDPPAPPLWRGWPQPRRPRRERPRVMGHPPRGRSARARPTRAVETCRSMTGEPRPRPAPSSGDPFGARRPLGSDGTDFYALSALEETFPDLVGAPLTLRILLENALRHAGHGIVEAHHVKLLAAWRPGAPKPPAEIPFLPSRVLLQDYTGVPAIVDLAALRDAVAAAGGDPAAVRPHVPVDLVIDHSVQVGAARSPDAYAINVAREYERNGERYRLLRWAQATLM